METHQNTKLELDTDVPTMSLFSGAVLQKDTVDPKSDGRNPSKGWPRHPHPTPSLSSFELSFFLVWTSFTAQKVPGLFWGPISQVEKRNLVRCVCSMAVLAGDLGVMSILNPGIRILENLRHPKKSGSGL